MHAKIFCPEQNILPLQAKLNVRAPSSLKSFWNLAFVYTGRLQPVSGNLRHTPYIENTILTENHLINDLKLLPYTIL